MPVRTAARIQSSNADNFQDLFAKTTSIFDQVQNTAANHQKNIVALHKIYVDITQIRGKTKDGATILIGEKKFEQTIYFLLLRLLETKKGTPGDRVARFVASFVKYLNDKCGLAPSMISRPEANNTCSWRGPHR